MYGLPYIGGAPSRFRKINYYFFFFSLTHYANVAQLVEHHHGKVGVIGSIPIIGSEVKFKRNEELMIGIAGMGSGRESIPSRGGKGVAVRNRGFLKRSEASISRSLTPLIYFHV